jgi:hypothetical protein
VNSKTKGRLLMGGKGQRKETKNLNVVDVLTARNEYRNFKQAGFTMGKGLGRNEKD